MKKFTYPTALLRNSCEGFIWWLQRSLLGWMSRAAALAYKTRNRPSYNEALRRRGPLTIRLDPEMIRDAKPTGRRGGKQTYATVMRPSRRACP
ncbi:hypothetical protein JSE7799_00695 [Jannaschia seosinensis]|uniref:Transposase n=1 Tax=Jannaschia seosinensis TaxID=313367 RepID=A0A0M7B855_9RHOB|nr:hypothetical protein JSE7799_00695 [Jannaschia seosinensis]